MEGVVREVCTSLKSCDLGSETVTLAYCMLCRGQCQEHSLSVFSASALRICSVSASSMGRICNLYFLSISHLENSCRNR